MFVGDDAKAYFTNLRTRYTRDRKKVKKVKVSGTGSEEIEKANDSVDDMFYFLTWLDPFYKPRKTSDNFSTTIMESRNNEEMDDSGPGGADADHEENVDDNKSDTTDASSVGNSSSVSDIDMQSSTNFRQGKKAKRESKKVRGTSNIDVTNAEIQVLNSIGEALKPQSSSTNAKDEDELFGALVSSQIRQIPPERRLVVKMQISNMIYQEILGSLSAVSTYTRSSTAGQTWQYPEQQPQPPPHSQNSQPRQFERSRHSPFTVPNPDNSNNEPLYQPGHFFYQQQSRPNVGFLDDLNSNQ